MSKPGSEPTARWISSRVPARAAGWTLERYFKDEMHLSGRMLQRLTRIRGLRWNKEPAFLARKVREGDLVSYKSKPRAAAPSAGARGPTIRIPLLWEDRDYTVVDKPAGLDCHSHGKRHGPTLVDALRAQWVDRRPPTDVHLVHRLDRLTSGALWVAKSSQAHARADTVLRDGGLERTYLALVHGSPPSEHGVIEGPIARVPGHRSRRRIAADGAAATTEFEVLRRDGEHTLVRLRPRTGRTHQLRVHLAHLGHPLLGDVLYGGPQDERLWLHAWKLAFQRPDREERTEVEAEPPEALRP